MLINDKGWLMTSLWDGMLAANQADTDCLIDPAAGTPHVPYDLRTGLKTRPSYIGTHNTVYRTHTSDSSRTWHFSTGISNLLELNHRQCGLTQSKQ